MMFYAARQYLPSLHITKYSRERPGAPCKKHLAKNSFWSQRLARGAGNLTWDEFTGNMF